ncbi:MAG: biotin/lipoyl-binding protein [Saprospiraceae bacterium]|nr:biotin/lipoyl-binding protein [Saprospiraceae bacterium]
MLIDSIGLRLSEKKIDDILKAPMPGLVINVSVTPNQIVKKGDNLITLEAMKMENVLKAHHDGVIKSVNVLKGEKVEKGQILIEFEN